MDKLGPVGCPCQLQITFSWGSHLGNAARSIHSLRSVPASFAGKPSKHGLSSSTTSVPGSWKTSSQPNKWMSWYSTSTVFHWTLSLHLHYHWTSFGFSTTHLGYQVKTANPKVFFSLKLSRNNILGPFWAHMSHKQDRKLSNILPQDLWLLSSTARWLLSDGQRYFAFLLQKKM